MNRSNKSRSITPYKVCDQALRRIITRGVYSSMTFSLSSLIFHSLLFFHLPYPFHFTFPSPPFPFPWFSSPFPFPLIPFPPGGANYRRIYGPELSMTPGSFRRKSYHQTAVIKKSTKCKYTLFLRLNGHNINYWGLIVQWYTSYSLKWLSWVNIYDSFVAISVRHQYISRMSSSDATQCPFTLFLKINGHKIISWGLMV